MSPCGRRWRPLKKIGWREKKEKKHHSEIIVSDGHIEKRTVWRQHLVDIPCIYRLNYKEITSRLTGNIM